MRRSQAKDNFGVEGSRGLRCPDSAGDVGAERICWAWRYEPDREDNAESAREWTSDRIIWRDTVVGALRCVEVGAMGPCLST